MSHILHANELLFTNQTLTSVNGDYILMLQADGDMVLYEKVHNEDGSIVLDQTWTTGTIGLNAFYAVMQEDGDFVLSDPQGVTLWHSDTDGRPGSFLQLQDDGNLVINEISQAWMAAGAEDDEDEEEYETASVDAIDAADKALEQQADEALEDDARIPSAVFEK